MSEHIQIVANESGTSYIENIQELYQAMDDPEVEQDKMNEIIDELESEPLSIQVKRQLEILLSTGGPATRILYDIDSEAVHYQFQDWFQPWTSAQLTAAQEDMLLEHVQRTYGGLIETFE